MWLSLPKQEVYGISFGIRTPELRDLFPKL